MSPQADGGVPGWVRDAIVYQIFPDRFASSERVAKPGPLEAWDAPPTRNGFKGGDLLGVVEHLDHIQQLGADTISLNPVFASASNHRYHPYDYFAVDPLLGGDAALRELIDAAHARGMRVILDGVFNHAGRGFWPFHHVLEVGRHSPYRDWFHLDRRRLASGRRPHAYPSDQVDEELDASWPERHAAGRESLHRLGYRAWWDLPALPKLNLGNRQVRGYLLNVVEHWLRFGADGWRLDAVDDVRDRSFWRDLRARARAANPDAYLLAEVWHARPALVRGDTFDALMNYPFLAATLSFAGGPRIDAGLVSRHFGLRDRIRPIDGPGFARRLDRLVNRYRADVAQAQLNLVDGHDTPRLLSVCSSDVASARLAVLVQATVPGVPCVYYGYEIGLPGGLDPDSRRAFPWDRGRWNEGLLAYTRWALALRRDSAVLRRGAFRVLAARGGALAWLRSDGRDALVVAANNAERETVLRVRAEQLAGRRLDPVAPPGGRDDSGTAPRDVALQRDGSLAIRLEARSGVVLRIV
ncbi:MAG TPA: glycoside hydrolase family 13 protein [Candidatus Limnocylindria bacterium]|nr:glycoside hydrolase family 13 protein [Candidatus Limnocylindria bacterium]